MKKLRVLLVDDEIMIREGFKRLFDWEAHDCEVAGEAGDGMEALTQIDALRPDIVIMDINIPIMNGQGDPAQPHQAPGHRLCHRVGL